MIPIFELSSFSYNKKTKHLTMYNEATVPPEFFIRSNHTGRTVRFVVDQQDMIRNEFYDGEIATFMPYEHEERINVTRVVIVRGEG